MTLFKKCSRNFNLSKNMALVDGDFLHYTDIKKSSINLLLWKSWSDFEIISQKRSFCDLSQKLLAKFWSVYEHGSGKWGLFALYTAMKKFLKNLLRNRRSDFEIISQELPLGDPFQKQFVKFWSVHIHGSGRRGVATCTKQTLGNSLTRGPWWPCIAPLADTWNPLISNITILGN